MKDAIRNHFGGDYSLYYKKYLPGAKKIGGSEYKAICPFHDDRDPSFCFNSDKGQYYCQGCGKKGDIFHFYAKLNGFNTRANFGKILRGIANDFGIAVEHQKPKMVKAYDYVDENGDLIFQVCRMEPKSFRQRRPNGKGGFIWNLKGIDELPLYRLLEVMRAPEVLIVEGEKDCDNLAELGFCATTCAGGAKKWRDHHNQYLEGKRVVLIPDNDAVRYAGLNGKVVFESSKSTKFKDAQALYNARKSAVAKGKQPEAVKIKNYTFKQLAKEYDKFAQKQRCYRTTKKYTIEKVADKFGHLPLRSFDIKLLEQYQTELLKTKAPATANRYLRLIQHMFTKAADWSMVEEAICSRVHKVKALEEQNERVRYLTEQECKKLVYSCRPQIKLIVTTALNSGMRKQEVLKLIWQQVDLANGLIHLDKTKSGKRREVPINDVLKKTLNSVIRRIDIDYVFYNPKTCKPYWDIRKTFKAALKKANITDFVFHDCRHTYASHFVMNGGSLKALQEILGHENIKITMKYAHLSPEYRKEAANRVRLAA